MFIEAICFTCLLIHTFSTCYHIYFPMEVKIVDPSKRED